MNFGVCFRCVYVLMHIENMTAKLEWIFVDDVLQLIYIGSRVPLNSLVFIFDGNILR